MQLGSLVERCKLPQRGLGQWKSNLMHFSLKIVTSGGTNFTIEHKLVLSRHLNNLEIRYKNVCIFLTGGAYTPCMFMPLSVASNQIKMEFGSVVPRVNMHRLGRIPV